MSSSYLFDENENVFYWNKFLEGDTHAFEKLMRDNYKDLFNYGTRFTKDKELVKDCIQDLFLVLWKNRLTVSKTEFVKYYLLKSLRRKLSKTINGHNHSSINNSSVDIELHFHAGFDDPVEFKIIQWENYAQLSKKLRSLLTTLSKREQEIIYLRFYIGVHYNEIAEIMNINRQSAYNLLHEALRKLKRNFT